MTTSNRPVGRKPGRPADPDLAIYRALFGPVWSERTIGRYRVCMKRLSFMGIHGPDAIRLVLAKVPGGTAR